MAALFRWLLRRSRTLVSLPENVPGPSPWYLRPHAPDVPDHTWREAGVTSPCAGKTFLVGPAGPVLGVDFMHWISVIEGRLLLIWHQPHVRNGPTRRVTVTALDPRQLAALGKDTAALCESMKRDEIPLLYSGTPVAHLDLDTTVVGRPIRFGFPPPVDRIPELLILCHSSGIGGSAYLENLALLVAHPTESTYQLYPQDWFNQARLDYGYQWVTRVARDPITGHVCGEGIRISPFILDDSLRRRA